MPTQNIVVKWTEDTSSLVRSQSTINKAQKATDDLRKSTQAYGGDAQKAGAQATKSFDSVGKEIQGLNKGFGDLVGTVRTFIAALAIKEIANASLEIATLAGNVEGVERAFRRLPNSTALINDLREATAGTVSDFQLMQTAIKAQNFNIPLTQLGTLLEFAAAKAQQTGESVEYLVDSIVTGIGRESPLILDNLQLRMQDLQAVMRETGVSLGEAVGVVAQRQLEQMGGLAETGATKVQKLKSAWVNFTSEAAKDFYKKFGLGEAIDKLTDTVSFEKAEEKFKNQLELFRQFNVPIDGPALSTIRRSATGQLGPNEIKFIDAEVEKLRKTVAGLAETYDIFTVKEIGAQRALAEITEEFEKNSFFIKDADKAARNFIQTLIDEQNQSAISARLAAAERLEQLRKDKFERDYLKTKKQVNLELFQAAENEKLVAEATKLLQPELDKLAKSFSIGSVNIEDFNEEIGKSINEVRQLLDSLDEDVVDAHIRSFGEIVGDAFEEVREELAVGGINIAQDFLNQTIQQELDAYAIRINNLRSFYDEQTLLAGDNDRAKQELRIKEQRQLDQLRREQAQKEKEARKFSVIIDTAAALARIWINPGFPLAIPYSALIVAQGAAQLAAIGRAQPRGFAKGVVNLDGPGNSKSDSIPAMLSKGESVITAERTKKAFNVITEVSAGRLDDKVMEKLQKQTPVIVQGMDDTRIIAAIKAQNYPDYFKVGNIIYEARRAGETHIKKVKKYSF